MRKLFITICNMDTVPYLPDGVTTIAFGAPIYEHTYRKINDAVHRIGLNVEVVRASNHDEVMNASHKITPSFEDIVVFASPLAFLAGSKDIEGAIDYVIKSDVGYATVGSLRSLYLSVGQGKMLTDCEVGSCSDFVAAMNQSPAKTFSAHFLDSEKSVPPSKLDYLKKLEAYRHELLDYLVMNGVDIELRDGVIISPMAEIQPGAVIKAGTSIVSDSKIMAGCVIGPNATIIGSEIGEGCIIGASTIENCDLERDVTVDSYTIIKGTHILSEAKVDSSCLISSCTLNQNTHICTGSVLHDASVGSRAVVGSGVVCVDFSDSKKASSIKIGDDSLIGNNATLISPVTIGSSAFIAAGSTITDDVPQGHLGIAREYQVNRSGWGRKKRHKNF
ncbi:MAG: hypothetical protein IJ309_04980 [Clostridia bacterium]|nr:hypothetical protein [Clostridia bacterium]